MAATDGPISAWPPPGATHASSPTAIVAEASQQRPCRFSSSKRLSATLTIYQPPCDSLALVSLVFRAFAQKGPWRPVRRHWTRPGAAKVDTLRRGDDLQGLGMKTTKGLDYWPERMAVPSVVLALAFWRLPRKTGREGRLGAWRGRRWQDFLGAYSAQS